MFFILPQLCPFFKYLLVNNLVFLIGGLHFLPAYNDPVGSALVKTSNIYQILLFWCCLLQMPLPGPSKSRCTSSSSGASFMPTMSRSRSDADYAHPAHMVQQHVPSLRRRGKIDLNFIVQCKPSKPDLHRP